LSSQILIQLWENSLPIVVLFQFSVRFF